MSEQEISEGEKFALDRSEKYYREHKDPVIRSRFEKAYNFYTDSNKGNIEKYKALQHLEGINFNRPIREVTIKPGKEFHRYSKSSKASNYFTRTGRLDNLGIAGSSTKSHEGRNKFCFKTTNSHRPTKALISTAKDMSSWENGELNYGGGRQYFVPDRHLKNFKHSTIESLNKITREKNNARFKKFDASKIRVANDNQTHPPKEPKKARLINTDRPKSKPANENQNSVKRKSKDLLKARLKLNKSGDRKSQSTAKERFKACYGKPKDAKINLVKSLKEKQKASPKSKDSPSAKNKTPNLSKDPRVAPTAESSGAKKTGTTKEKKASLRNGYQKRDKALKATRDKKTAKPNSNRENVKSRYGKQSDSNRTQKAETRKSSDSRQAKSSSTPKTDTKSKPSGDTKPRGGGGGGGGTSRRR